jgi:fermentation-respiration switch protein FrsA (DUF1100 family)
MANATLRYRQAQYKSCPLIRQGRARYDWIARRCCKQFIFFAHGNAEDLGYIKSRLEKIRDLGFSVFAYDYRGYGTSEGTPTEKAAYQDIQTAYNYLTQTLKITPQQIIVFGRSVDGGSAVDVASKKPVAGLIVESSFTSIFRVVVSVPLLPFDKFTNLDKIKKVNCPVLIIHGKSDEIIPFILQTVHSLTKYETPLQTSPRNGERL